MRGTQLRKCFNRQRSRCQRRGNLVDGQRQGQYVRYYPSGNIEMSCNYVDGKLDGPIVFYHEHSGLVSRSATYTDGVLAGVENVYYEDGKLKSVLVHGNNALESMSSYYKSGAIFQQLKRNSGEPFATMILYYENGKIREIIKTLNTRPEGEYIAYYEDGTVKKTGFYSNGQLTGKWLFYGRNGRLEREINY